MKSEELTSSSLAWRESKTVNGVGSGIRYGRFLSRIVNFVINVNFISLFRSLGREKYNLSQDRIRKQKNKNDDLSIVQFKVV